MRKIVEIAILRDLKTLFPMYTRSRANQRELYVVTVQRYVADGRSKTMSLSNFLCANTVGSTSFVYALEIRVLGACAYT